MFNAIARAFRYLVPDFNTRYLRKLDPLVDEVNHLEAKFAQLSDAQLRAKTDEFRNRMAHEGKTLDDLLPEAFAVVREASKRVLSMRHFDVQLIGGMVLHKGNIAEMKTGEGKTLVATLPLYLNALEGKGCHLVTVNDYLARRDSQWMGQIYSFLGLTTGLIVHGLNSDQRRRSYHADITYGTNNEFGFDYLRDNMAIYKEELCQRELNFAIVDEVDSILVDEARTPLIISGPADTASEEYQRFARIARALKKDRDYTVDAKAHTVIPTEDGIAEAERLANVQNLYATENMKLVHYLNAALKAKELYERDKAYVVTEQGEIVIVDEFTGRLMPGRRWSDGIHQSVEAKEGVPVVQETQTLGTITFQNLFRMYKKLGGMTGTARTEAREFAEIYKLDVIEIPTNVPVQRQDLRDVIFKSEEEKFKAITLRIKELHEAGQPVLVGTVAIETSEMLSRRLKVAGVPHQVLNAKHHQREAQIVAQAGRLGAVTIATNMAGRGTDIKLGGNPEALALDEVGASPVSVDVVGAELVPAEAALLEEWRVKLKAATEKHKAACEDEKKKVIEKGGLFILGTERHDSRRIDNQLRGRSGRQGDPGASQFFISMEDKLMRLFGGPSIKGMIEKLGWEEDEALEHEWIDSAVERSQARVEAHHFDARKHVLKYDDVMNEQRKFIYKERRQVLELEEMGEFMLPLFEDVVENLVETHLDPKEREEDWNFDALVAELDEVFTMKVTPDELRKYERDELKETLTSKVRDLYAQLETRVTKDMLARLGRFILLQVIDEQWKDHLYAMDGLQEGVGLQGYAGKDPLTEYKINSASMFEAMIERIRAWTARHVFRISFDAPKQVEALEQKAQQEHEERELYYGGGDAEAPAPKPEAKAKQAVKRPGRNDPCPCGSGQKYKKCCGK